MNVTCMETTKKSYLKKTEIGSGKFIKYRVYNGHGIISPLMTKLQKYQLISGQHAMSQQILEHCRHGRQTPGTGMTISPLIPVSFRVNGFITFSVKEKGG